MKDFWIHTAAYKVTQLANLQLSKPNRDLSPHVRWPGSYIHLRRPFANFIKEAADLKEAEGENGGAESLTSSTMTIAVFRVQPSVLERSTSKDLKPHGQSYTELSLRGRELASDKTTGKREKRKKQKQVYKQLAARKQQREKLPKALFGFPKR